jgi:hypothetical protein
MVVLICYTCIHYYYHTSFFSRSWPWSYSSSYCVTLVFTTITMLHTSVRRGRDRIVVLIVLHLYSLLLPYFILQSVVVVIVWQFLLCYTCIHYYYHASFFSPSWSWLYGSLIYNYLCNQSLSSLSLWVRILFMARCTRYNIMWIKFLSDLWQVGGFLQFPPPIKHRHKIIEILLQVAINTINQTISLHSCKTYSRSMY